MYDNFPNKRLGLANFTDKSLNWDQGIVFLKIQNAVRAELEKATANYGPMVSEHEAYAIMLEEFDELWDEIKKKPSVRSKEKMAEEAIQCMAMLARFIIDCQLPVDKV